MSKISKTSVVLEELFPRGQLVWAKIKYSCWWPAMIITADDCGRDDEAQMSERCVYWFSDNRISFISIAYIRNFTTEMHLWRQNDKRERYQNAVMEAIWELSLRIHEEISDDSNEALIQWAKNSFKPYTNMERVHKMTDGVKGNLSHLRKYFWKLKSKNKAKKGVNFGTKERGVEKVHDSKDSEDQQKSAKTICVTGTLNQRTKKICVFCSSNQLASASSSKMIPGAENSQQRKRAKNGAEDGKQARNGVEDRKQSKNGSEDGKRSKNGDEDRKRAKNGSEDGKRSKNGVEDRKRAKNGSEDEKRSKNSDEVRQLAQNGAEDGNKSLASSSKLIRKSEDSQQILENPAKKFCETKDSSQRVCISCANPSRETVGTHPLFGCGLCRECQPKIDRITQNLQVGKYHGLCVVCGNKGQLVTCGVDNCRRSYCRRCVLVFGSEEQYSLASTSVSWICYLCSNFKSINNIQSIKKIPLKIDKLQQPLKEDDSQPTLNVISFNDIGKGVLNKLGFQAGNYYIFYPPEDTVPSTQADVTIVGNIKKIRNDMVSALLPIHLVLGVTLRASLSKRKLHFTTGLELIFLHFYRVTKVVNSIDKCSFWIFVSEVKSTEGYKPTITRFMNCDPHVTKLRPNYVYYVWTNIPHAQRICEKISSIANTSERTPLGSALEMAEKDEYDILEAFMESLKKHFKLLPH